MSPSNSTPQLSHQRASAEMVLSSLIWGFGFIATVWAMEMTNPAWVNVLRFFGAFFLSCLVGKIPTKKYLIHAAIPGFFLSATLLLQTYGLKYTTPTKSSFITVLYVLMVPIMEWVAFGSKVSPHLLFWIATGFGGTVLITQVQVGEFNVGDLLTLGCAITAAFHILWIAKVQTHIKSPFRFNSAQALWAGIFCLIFALPTTPFEWFGSTVSGWAGLFSITVGSTLIAFALQVRAQGVLSPTVASLLFLLESPFAAIYSFLFMNERLTLNQWLGAALILVSALGAILSEFGLTHALFRRLAKGFFTKPT